MNMETRDEKKIWVYHIEHVDDLPLATCTSQYSTTYDPYTFTRSGSPRQCPRGGTENTISIKETGAKVCMGPPLPLDIAQWRPRNWGHTAPWRQTTLSLLMVGERNKRNGVKKKQRKKNNLADKLNDQLRLVQHDSNFLPPCGASSCTYVIRSSSFFSSSDISQG